MAPRKGGRILAAAAAFAVLPATGCRNILYVPRIIPITEVTIPPFAGQPELSIANAGVAGEQVIADRGAATWRGDLETWSGVAVQMLTSELGQRGVTVKEGASKRVEVAVHQVQVLFGFATIRCILTLRAATGDGQKFVTVGNNVSPATIYRAIDGALSRAVAALLADPGFRAHLEAK